MTKKLHMSAVESTNVEKIGFERSDEDADYIPQKPGYSEEVGKLHVKFQSSDRVYVYEQVPAALHNIVMNAESVGRAVNKLIKPHYEVEPNN